MTLNAGMMRSADRSVRSPWGVRRLSALVGATLTLVALADFFFYRHPVGWTTALYGLALLALLHARFRNTLRRPVALALSAAVAGLCLAMALEPAPLAVLLAATLLVSLALLARMDRSPAIHEWARRQTRFIAQFWKAPVGDLARLHRIQRRRPLDASGIAGRLHGWIVPVILAFVFLLLFGSANPVLDRLFTSIGEWFGQFDELLARLLAPLRLVLWICFGMAVWTLLRGRIRPSRRPAGRLATSDLLETWDRRLSTDFAIRSLLLFNVVFLIQTGMDVLYLLGGAELPRGMTYAQYAHRGAYPLIFTALLAALFVLIAFRPGGPAESNPRARRLVYLWFAQNGFLTGTALWRLALYVQAYSLTRLRVAAAIWMLLVVGGLTLICLRIAARRPNAWLIGANVLMTLAVLYVCAFVPFKMLIAEFNVAHCAELEGGGPFLDIEYLYRLGPDALPAMRRYAALPSRDKKTERAGELASRLQRKLEPALADWRGWTWWRSRWAATGAPPALARLGSTP